MGWFTVLTLIGLVFAWGYVRHRENKKLKPKRDQEKLLRMAGYK